MLRLQSGARAAAMQATRRVASNQAAVAAAPSPLPLAPSLRCLHVSSVWRAMRNVTGSTSSTPRNVPPRPTSSTMTPPPPSQFARTQPAAPHFSQMPPPPHSPGGGSGPNAHLHPAFTPPGPSMLGRVMRLLLLLWVGNMAYRVYKLTPPSLSEEEQRRRQLERAKQRAARWRSPQDDLIMHRLMSRVDKLYSDMQLLVLRNGDRTPADANMRLVALYEAYTKLMLASKFNRLVEARPLPPDAKTIKKTVE